MITTIDNNQRVFLISYQGFKTMNIFCNLQDIPNVLKNEFEKNDKYIISHFWNGKFKRASRKYLNEMFAANKIDFKIK